MAEATPTDSVGVLRVHLDKDSPTGHSYEIETNASGHRRLGQMDGCALFAAQQAPQFVPDWANYRQGRADALEDIRNALGAAETALKFALCNDNVPGMRRDIEKAQVELEALRQTLDNSSSNAIPDVYQSEHGWGFMGCESDSYESEAHARRAAIEHAGLEDDLGMIFAGVTPATLVTAVSLDDLDRSLALLQAKLGITDGQPATEFFSGYFAGKVRQDGWRELDREQRRMALNSYLEFERTMAKYRITAGCERERVYDACGGCGATHPDQRCIGCLHPF